MTRKHYVVCPGYVISETDGDKHYITGQMLIRLYELAPREYSIHRGFRRDQSPILDPPPQGEVQLVFLHPSRTGNYGRPE